MRHAPPSTSCLQSFYAQVGLVSLDVALRAKNNLAGIWKHKKRDNVNSIPADLLYLRPLPTRLNPAYKYPPPGQTR